MGVRILQAADDRVIRPNAILVLHDGDMTMEAEWKSFENWAEWSKKNRKDFYKCLAERTGRTVRYWEKLCGSDYILSAEDALKEKLVDRIAGESVE